MFDQFGKTKVLRCMNKKQPHLFVAYASKCLDWFWSLLISWSLDLSNLTPEFLTEIGYDFFCIFIDINIQERLISAKWLNSNVLLSLEPEVLSFIPGEVESDRILQMANPAVPYLGKKVYCLGARIVRSALSTHYTLWRNPVCNYNKDWSSFEERPITKLLQLSASCRETCKKIKKLVEPISLQTVALAKQDFLQKRAKKEYWERRRREENAEKLKERTGGGGAPKLFLKLSRC